MEVYQPLNSYSFCKASNRKTDSKLGEQLMQFNQVETAKKTRPFMIKALISILIIALITVGTVLVKIDAKEPISTIVAVNESEIVVGSGDTLWRLASVHYPEIEDTGFAIHLIKERNGFHESTIFPGQKIILPHIE